MTPTADVSALVVSYNTAGLAYAMLRSFARDGIRGRDGRPLSLEFVFVDNQSPIQDSEAIEAIRALGEGPLIRGEVVMNDENAGYARGMNLALSRATGRILLVLNPDLILLPGAAQALFDTLVGDPSIGLVGPVGYWEETREAYLPPNIMPTLADLCLSALAQVSVAANRRYVSTRLTNALAIFDARGDLDVEMLSGACLMLERSLLDEIGGLFDPRFPLYYEDTDLFRRVRAHGKRLVLVRDATMAHFYNRAGATNPGEAFRRYWVSKRLYYDKWYGGAGGSLCDLSRRVLHSERVARTRARLLEGITDLGVVSDMPDFVCGASCERYVVEFAYDPFFLLAGAVFGSGDRWIPGPNLWTAFGDEECYLRIVDLAAPGRPEIARYRFRRCIESVVADSPEASKKGEEPQRVGQARD